MVCDGPDPPENNPHELNPPPRHELIMNGQQTEDSDEETNEYFGYEPLAQGPEAVLSDRDSDDDVPNNVTPTSNVPPIDSMDNILTRELWNVPRNSNNIEMDNERAQQVMTAMANFSLPQASIPEWALSISEEQWKQTLFDTIEKMKNNR